MGFSVALGISGAGEASTLSLWGRVWSWGSGLKLRERALRHPYDPEQAQQNAKPPQWNSRRQASQLGNSSWWGPLGRQGRTTTQTGRPGKKTDAKIKSWGRCCTILMVMS